MVYERLVGPIPEDIDLHHRCPNKACVNPEHLEPRRREAHRGKPGSLSHAQIDLLWRLLDRREPLDRIAARLGVSERFLRGVKLETVYDPKRTSDDGTISAHG